MTKRSKRQIVIAFVAICLLIASALGVLPAERAKNSANTESKNAAVFSAEEFYPVSRVVDGDTIKVNINGQIETVRLIGLDTPELVDPRKPVQCFALEASDEAKKILVGQFVRLETDVSQGTRDKYGRLLAYAYVNANSDPRGILVNKYMIAEGYGHEYTYNIPYKYQEEFKTAESFARQGEKGLWARDACAR